MKLTGEQAVEFLYSRTSPDCPGLEREADQMVGSGRWTSHHLLVLKDRDGRFWAAPYEQGLTENQDIQPFEYEEEVEFYQIEKVPVISYEYRKI